MATQVATQVATQADAGGFQLTQKLRVPSDARADYDNAIRLVSAGQYDQGIALLKRVTEKAPAAAAAYVDLGIAYGAKGDPTTACRQNATLQASVLSETSPVLSELVKQKKLAIRAAIYDIGNGKVTMV